MDAKGSNFSSMIEEKAVDFGKQSQDYAKHRPGFPARFFYRLGKVLSQDDDGKLSSEEFDWSGLRVLDIGTGPGIVALEIAQRGASVVGVDIAENQIAAAKQRAEELKLSDKAAFFVGTAEKTDQKDEAFDLITAGQCWPWFKHDKAMPELARVLAPGGYLCVCQYCYLPAQSPVAKETEDLILKYNPKWTMSNGDGIYPSQINQLVVDGKFELIEQFSFDCEQPFTHESWRGRMRTCNGVGSGVLTEDQIKDWDAELGKLLKNKYPENFTVAHRVWAVVVRKRPTSAVEEGGGLLALH